LLSEGLKDLGERGLCFGIGIDACKINMEGSEDIIWMEIFFGLMEIIVGC
jgi:hypothetical protein